LTRQQAVWENNMKNNKYHTVKTVSISKRKV